MKHYRHLVHIAFRLLLIAGWLWPAFALASAGRPLPPSGIYAVAPVPDDPAPAPAADLAPETSIYNELVAEQSNGARNRSLSIIDSSPRANGPGVSEEATSIARGGTLFPAAGACLNFDDVKRWNGHGSYASYGNWGTFSVDDGGFYRSDHVRFDREQAVGSQYSLKISGEQPYAAGLISPVISAPPGAVVEVRVKYLMFDHDGLRIGDRVINDWVSLGLKPEARGQEARYVNGYVRGQWGQMVNNIVAGPSGEILVMLQAESPAAFNSNIYFDDVEILIDGVPLSDCS